MDAIDILSPLVYRYVFTNSQANIGHWQGIITNVIRFLQKQHNVMQTPSISTRGRTLSRESVCNTLFNTTLPQELLR
jgi:hypothetical protein